MKYAIAMDHKNCDGHWLSFWSITMFLSIAWHSPQQISKQLYNSDSS